MERPQQCSSWMLALRQTSPSSTSWLWQNFGRLPLQCQISVLFCSQTGIFFFLSFSPKPYVFSFSIPSRCWREPVTLGSWPFQRQALSSLWKTSPSCLYPIRSQLALQVTFPDPHSCFTWGIVLAAEQWTILALISSSSYFQPSKTSCDSWAPVREIAFLTKAAKNLIKTDTEVACWHSALLCGSPLSLSLLLFSSLKEKLGN